MDAWTKGYRAFHNNKKLRWWNSTQFKEGWERAAHEMEEGGFSTGFAGYYTNYYKMGSLARKHFQIGLDKGTRAFSHAPTFSPSNI